MAEKDETSRGRWSGYLLMMLPRGLTDSTSGRQTRSEQTQHRDVPDQAGGSFHGHHGVRQSCGDDRAGAHDTDSTPTGSQSHSTELKISKNESGSQAREHAFKERSAIETHNGQETLPHRRQVLQSPSAPSDSPRTEMETIAKADSAALRTKDDEIATLQRKIQELKHHYEQRLQAERTKLDAASSKIQQQNKWLEEMHLYRQRGDGELKKLRTLLEDRAEEVKVAQAFMTTADKYSVSEVSQMVEQLNDEIYQCAIGLSDAVMALKTTSAEQMHSEDWKRRVEDARHTLGWWNAETINRLQADLSRDDPDTTLFECMIQYVLVTRCGNIIQSFCLHDKKVHQYLSELWEEIAASHETSIAKNWLAITSSRLKILGKPLSRTSIMRQLASLALLSGRQSPSAAWLEDAIGAKLDEVTRKAVTVKAAMTEGVLSTDIEVFYPGQGSSYKPAEMRDAYEAPGKPRLYNPVGEAGSMRERIVCCTGLGVCRIVRQAPSSASSSLRRKRELVLKPKVLLYLTLDE